MYSEHEQRELEITLTDPLNIYSGLNVYSLSTCGIVNPKGQERLGLVATILDTNL